MAASQRAEAAPCERGGGGGAVDLATQRDRWMGGDIRRVLLGLTGEVPLFTHLTNKPYQLSQNHDSGGRSKVCGSPVVPSGGGGMGRPCPTWAVGVLRTWAAREARSELDPEGLAGSGVPADTEGVARWRGGGEVNPTSVGGCCAQASPPETGRLWVRLCRELRWPRASSSGPVGTLGISGQLTDKEVALWGEV